jgi:hypothetical protein
MRLCVGPLALTTSEEALRQLCEPDGIVERVPIITERETNRSCGFGFVELPNATETTATLAWAKCHAPRSRGVCGRATRRGRDTLSGPPGATGGKFDSDIQVILAGHDDLATH